MPRRSLFILLSDFFTPLEEVKSALRFLYYHGHEAIVLQTLDVAERTFPFDRNMQFRGLEDGRQLIAEPHRLRQRYLEILEEFTAGVRKAAQDCAFDYQILDSPEDLGVALSALLALRSNSRKLVRRGRGG